MTYVLNMIHICPNNTQTKLHQLDCEPQRRNKHLAVYNEVLDEPLDMFDKVLQFNTEDESVVSNPEASQIVLGHM